jgi:hypothetical protein
MSFLSSRGKLAPQGIGKSVPRREDARLLTGAGRYANDFSLPGQAYAYFVRSPHAHASIVNIDVTEAIAAPDVLAVLTGSDAATDGLRPIPHSSVPTNQHEVPLKSRDGSAFFIAPHPVLAVDVVRYVGEPLVVIVAETLAHAIDAAERVDVVYEPLAAVARSHDALSPGAPPVWEQHGSNPCIDSEAGDKEAIEAAFARAAYVVQLQTTLNRVTGCRWSCERRSEPTTRLRPSSRSTPAPAAAWSASVTTSPEPCAADFFGGAVFFRGAAFGVGGLRASLTALPAWKRTALLAAISMVSPVRGFRPSRAGRAATLKMPRPETRTTSPAKRASRMAFTTAFTA